MTEHRTTNRRTVLRTIGAGVAGTALMAGTATAGGPDETIVMRGFNFDPKKTSIDLADGPKTVRWIYDEVVGSEPNHNVVLVGNRKAIGGENDWGTGYVQSKFIMQSGQTYDVKFSESRGDLIIEEVGGATGSKTDEDEDNDLEEAGGEEKATLSGALAGGSTSVDYVCSHHAANMWGRLEITD